MMATEQVENGSKRASGECVTKEGVQMPTVVENKRALENLSGNDGSEGVDKREKEDKRRSVDRTSWAIEKLFQPWPER